MANIIRTTPEIAKDIESNIERYNAALNLGDVEKRNNEVEAVMSALPSLEQEYAQTSEYEKLLALSQTEKPMIEAITNPAYKTMRHREVRDESTKMVIGLESTESARNIDLLRLDRFMKYKASHIKGWENYISKFNALVVLRMASELGVDTAKIKKTYYLSQKAQEIEMGKTPTSNTQLLKMLQQVVDAVIFEDDGKGDNKYKATSHDVQYILKTCTKAGKGICQVLVCKDTVVRNLVLSVLHNIVTKCGYTVDGYRKVKSN